MDSDEKQRVPPLLPEGRFSGRSEFTELLRQAFAVAAGQGWREIILADPSFADWPLGERVVVQALQDWSSAGRKLTMLAKNYDEIVRQHPRFVTWRRTCSHIVECRASATTATDDMPSALWSPVWLLERRGLALCTGITSSDAARRVALRERLNERLHKSTLSFPATTLGL